jgi:hypothetical protein
MLTASQIIARLGSPAAVAKALNVPLTTVASWGAANFIPEWRQPALLQLALDQAEPLSTADFPSKEQRVARTKAAA